MPEGGRLVVAAENRELGPSDPMCAAVGQPGEYVVLRFQDSGPRAASPAGKGASLGLPMARTMARAVGGGLLAEPAPEGGAQITLCLPRAT
jgi:signal transduction histidine kinase